MDNYKILVSWDRNKTMSYRTVSVPRIKLHTPLQCIRHLFLSYAAPNIVTFVHTEVALAPMPADFFELYDT